VSLKLNIKKLLQNLRFIEKHTKQSGRGKFGDIVFKLSQLMKLKESSKRITFVNAVKGGNVPKEYIPSVEKGFREAMKTGPLAGYQVDSLKVTDGSFTLSILMLSLAARMGYREVAKLQVLLFLSQS
jgi:elongation factor G